MAGKNAGQTADHLADGFKTVRSGNASGLGSSESHIYASVRPVEEVFPELKGVNPHYVPNAPFGTNINCVECVNATAKRLTGENPNAIARMADRYFNDMDLLPGMPFGFLKGVSTPEQAILTMKEAGHGSVGVVVVSQPSGIGSSINIVNSNGEIYFIDSQIGKIVELNPNLTIRMGVR